MASRMELSVGNKPNARPTSDDIERAIDETPKAADWHLHLQSNGEDSIEAFAEADGRYRVTFTEQERRFNAASPVGADTAKAIFVDYLNGDTDWRRKFRFVLQPSRGSRSRASRRISSEPPVWAIIVVAAAFFGVPALALLPESWRARLPAGSGVVWLVAGPIVVMALAMLVNKMLQARRASVWSQAAGRITKSEVGANYRRPSGRPVELTNYPAVQSRPQAHRPRRGADAFGCRGRQRRLYAGLPEAEPEAPGNHPRLPRDRVDVDALCRGGRPEGSRPACRGKCHHDGLVGGAGCRADVLSVECGWRQ
jgi:hypothetical protein